MKTLGAVILMLTSMSASAATLLVAFHWVTVDQGAAIGGVISALAVGWHSVQLRGGGNSG